MNVVLYIVVLRHNQIHDDGGQEDNGYAVFCKDGTDQSREDIEHFRYLSEAQTNAQRQCSDGDIALRITTITDHL